MTLEAFVILLSCCAVVASLITEAVKEFFNMKDVQYASNIVVFVVAMVVGCAGAMLYYFIFLVPVTPMNCIMAVFLGLANWVGAMVGYDKVKQAIKQMEQIKG